MNGAAIPFATRPATALEIGLQRAAAMRQVTNPQPTSVSALAADLEGRITYRRAADIQAKPIRWLWPGRIARGKVTVLAGNPDLGKSQVTASASAVVSTGGT